MQDDIVVSHEDDFPKYRKRAAPILPRHTMQSAAVQATKKFVYSQVGGHKTADVRKATDMLTLAGMPIPVTHTAADDDARYVTTCPLYAMSQPYSL